GLIAIVRLPWRGPQVMETLSQYLGAAQDIEIWATRAAHDASGFLLAVAVTAILLLLITYIFIPIGQTVSRQIELAPRTLYGYSWNLSGSLAGILAFFAVSWLALPPAVWFTIVLAGMALLQSNRSDSIWLAAAVLPVALLLFDPSTPHHFNLWTPYQQIEVEDQYLPDGEVRDTQIRVNHTGYQITVNLSPDFLARHPHLLTEAPDENPYDDPRVSAHLTDARAFMKRTTARYDLILFGLLDSHTQLSDYSNMRLDNFVYTEESFREARALLAPNGILFIKFQINHPFVGRRLDEMLTRTFGKAPVVFLAPSNYTAAATCFAISPSGQVEASLAADPRLSEFVAGGRPAFLSLPEVAVTTDDWPYLYHQGHWIPGIF